MVKTLVLLLAVFCIHKTSGDVNITDYIFWKKADITAWHQFFPSRVLEEERQTLSAALAAVSNISTGLNDSLSSVVTFQAQELATAELLMNGTDAQGCVAGIADFMENAISDELETYQDCAADASAKILRLNSTWAKVQAKYLAAYSRVLSGINACQRTYPNKDSWNRLVSCVESMNKNYYTAANATQAAMFPSPSMTYFQQTVVKCATAAAQNVASKGWKFLGMLVDCSKLTTTIDPVAYAEELDKWPGYNDTLQQQINISQSKNYNQVLAVELEMKEFYTLQKQALEQYVIESRGFDFYLNMTYLLLSDYYNTVIATRLDNPGDVGCADDAQTALDVTANDGANQSLACDLAIVSQTQALMSEVFADFLYLNNRMPSIGNVAILQCFSQGFIFAPNTISDCFDLVFTSFDVDHSERHVDIVADVTVLQNFVTSFFNGTSLPCGDTSLRRLLLGGDVALYDLQRCLYIGSGTAYAVSTPQSTTWAYTTTETPVFTSTSKYYVDFVRD